MTSSYHDIIIIFFVPSTNLMKIYVKHIVYTSTKLLGTRILHSCNRFNSHINKAHIYTPARHMRHIKHSHLKFILQKKKKVKENEIENEEKGNKIRKIKKMCKTKNIFRLHYHTISASHEFMCIRVCVCNIWIFFPFTFFIPIPFIF